jgi:hypothetical protein
MDVKRATLEELASTLGTKPQILNSDIRDLAWLWEQTVEEMRDVTPLAAFNLLYAIAKAYIRGRNCRMGNWQGILKHIGTKSAVMYLLMKQVSEDDVFETLHAWGVTSAEGFIGMARQLQRQGEETRGYDILADIERFLGEGGQDERGRH